MKLVYDVTRKEWPGAALTAPAVAEPEWRSDVANGTCSIDGCENGGQIRRGWCNKHYRRWTRYGDPLFSKRPQKAQERTCAVPECDGPYHAHGFCVAHAARFARHGDPLAGEPDRIRDPEASFWAKVDKNRPNGCWLWTATTNRWGYGRFHAASRHVQAHRFAYELLVGPIPEGIQLDHLCRVRHCVNPTHLEPVTQQENIRRGEAGAWNAAKTACPQGHDYTPENTRFYRGGRHCRTCHRAHMAAYRARKQAS